MLPCHSFLRHEGVTVVLINVHYFLIGEPIDSNLTVDKIGLHRNWRRNAKCLVLIAGAPSSSSYLILARS